jgi:hypothetical protein
MLLASQYFRRPPPPRLGFAITTQRRGVQTRRKVEKCCLHKSKEAPTARRTANHVKPSTCAGENKKRSSAAFGMVAASAHQGLHIVSKRNSSRICARQHPPLASRPPRPPSHAAFAKHHGSWCAQPAAQHMSKNTKTQRRLQAHFDDGLVRAARLHKRDGCCGSSS